MIIMYCRLGNNCYEFYGLFICNSRVDLDIASSWIRDQDTGLKGHGQYRLTSSSKRYLSHNLNHLGLIWLETRGWRGIYSHNKQMANAHLIPVPTLIPFLIHGTMSTT